VIDPDSEVITAAEVGAANTGDAAMASALPADLPAPVIDTETPRPQSTALADQAAATANEVGDDPTALSARQRLAPLLTSIQDPYLQALCQLAMAWISPVGDFDGALRAASVSLEQFRGQDEPFWTALAVVTLGSVETAMGRYDDALHHLREARDLGERFDNAGLKAWSRVHLGTLALVRGRLEEARAGPELGGPQHPQHDPVPGRARPVGVRGG
jgi:Tetratricopeptide repeat